MPTEADTAAWFASPGARSWTCGVAERVRTGEVRAFHAGLPGLAVEPASVIVLLSTEAGASPE